MQNKIEEIASKHLGKAGDGSVVKPYVTPDNVDPNLLVGVPRVLNRTQYGIDETNLPFTGSDTWNCYEFSALTNNGFPVCGVIRIVYNSDSTNIVESKSLKLYLNSFNMARMGDTVEEVINNVVNTITEDLKNTLGLVNHYDLEVAFCDEDTTVREPIKHTFFKLEGFLPVTKIKFDHFNEDPNILVVKETDDVYTERWRSAALRSNCRVTNQPDWGDVYIAVESKKQVTPESLLQYIVSMRKENHFHEEICECIYKRLHDLLEPENLFVACLYTRRGGIDINPARASSDAFFMKHAAHLIQPDVINVKTLRQ